MSSPPRSSTTTPPRSPTAALPFLSFLSPAVLPLPLPRTTVLPEHEASRLEELRLRLLQYYDRPSAIVLYDDKADEGNEISLIKGETIAGIVVSITDMDGVMIIYMCQQINTMRYLFYTPQQVTNGWWYGINEDGYSGLFPGMYLAGGFKKSILIKKKSPAPTKRKSGQPPKYKTWELKRSLTIQAGAAPPRPSHPENVADPQLVSAVGPKSEDEVDLGLEGSPNFKTNNQPLNKYQ
ncbi:hypothetical protein BGX26_011294 [Mortierella sp. AD094]|nr:hypothetical protein BGX26_011294 [Mortierella sp. AD094]